MTAYGCQAGVRNGVAGGSSYGRVVSCVLLVLACFLACVAGCAHETESPGVRIDAVEPDLVCNAQRVEPNAAVVITGKGFAPMPTKVLDTPVELMMPEVTIAKTQDLAGNEATGSEVVFPAEAGEELSDNLSWESSGQMTMRVTEDPPVALDPGLYDVTVENPDGHTRDTLEQGLAVVPPPRIDALEPAPPALCVEQDPRELVFNGANFLKVGSETPTVTFTPAAGDDVDLGSAADDCAAVPGTYAGGTIELCRKLTVDLPSDLAYGPYNLTATSPAPASCFSSEQVSMAVVPPPAVNADGIQVICFDEDNRRIIVTGGGFLKINDSLPSVEITGGGLGSPLQLQPDADSLGNCSAVEGVTGVESCTTFTLTVSETELPPAEYGMVITNPDPAGCSTAQETLSVEPPPEVDMVAPSTVCEGGSRLKITGSGFLDGAVVELHCPDGKVVESMSVEVVSATELRAVIGAGIVEGEVCDLVVANPDSCADEPPHEQVTGITGPFLFMADPFVVYNGINTPITLFLTTIVTDEDGLLPEGAVTLVNSADGEQVGSFDPQVMARYPNRAQFTVPTGQAAGQYDVMFEDQSGCFATLQEAFTVTDQTSVEIDQVVPPFGDNDTSTAVTIFRASSGDPFQATPRVFLAPSDGSGEAILLGSVSLSGDDVLTAIVPAGTAVDQYDIIVVNPDGSVGVATAAYSSVGDPPPVVDELAPQSLVVGNDPNQLTIKGTSFRNSEVSLHCVEPDGSEVDPPVTSGSVDCSGDDCTQTASADASGIANGTVCVVRVTNDDGTYGEFSSLGATNPSLNLSNPQPGTSLNVARRALVSGAVKATTAARFVYAVGGDGGPSDANAPFDSVEFASVDVFGEMQSWTMANDELAINAARSFAGSVTLGRYIYIFGGTDGTDALSNAERAIVLSPEEVPVIEDVDIVPDEDGLGGGLWSYRVSAVLTGADPDNPGGETLASSPLLVRLPSLDDGILTRVTISWSAPLDVLGDPLDNIAGYRIYRTVNPNETAGADEVLIAELDIADLPTLQYTDDGSDTPGNDPDRPLPLGSTGRWHAIDSLNTARMGPAGALARSPTAAGTWHIYALLGKSGGSEDSGTALDSYEYLTVTVGADGRQSIDAAGWTVGGNVAIEPRWLPGAWVVNASVIPSLADDSYVYVGGGRTTPVNINNDRTGTVEVAQVNDDGSLAAFDGAPDDLSSDRAGFGWLALGTSDTAKLLLFGGLQANPRNNAIGGTLLSATEIDNWNNEGLSMQQPRYLPGHSVQSAFIFLVGGQTDSDGSVTDTTETVIW